MKQAGADIQHRKESSALADGHLNVTWEGERNIHFEKGFSGMEALKGDQ